ncbi:unnamed protein product [Rotaria sordida]|nr:unnamed protein product [Rotaria sordida]
MNGTSINNNNKVNWLHLNKEQLIAALWQFVCMVDPNCQSSNKGTTFSAQENNSTVKNYIEEQMKEPVIEE